MSGAVLMRFVKEELVLSVASSLEEMVSAWLELLSRGYHWDPQRDTYRVHDDAYEKIPRELFVRGAQTPANLPTPPE